MCDAAHNLENSDDSSKPRLKKVYLLISNFEAEKCSCLLASGINFPTIDDHKLSDGTEVIDGYGRGTEDRQFNRLRFCPRLYSFAAVRRLHQAAQFLTKTSLGEDAPISLHVFAGSIHADRVLLDKMKHYLALLPRPPPPDPDMLGRN